MSEKPLSQSILDQIKEKKITPKPRWEFLLKDSVIWIGVAVGLFIGALALSILIEVIRMDDLQVIREFETGAAKWVIPTVITIWIVFLLAFIGIAYYNFYHTKKGYRFPIPTVIAAVLIIISAFGVVLYDAGITMRILNATEPSIAKLPSFIRVVHPRSMIWSQPETGTLSGIIVDTIDADEFLLQDRQNRIWHVLYEDSETSSTSIKLPPPGHNARVRCLGERLDQDTFKAVKILPWEREPKPLFLKPLSAPSQ